MSDRATWDVVDPFDISPPAVLEAIAAGLTAMNVHAPAGEFSGEIAIQLSCDADYAEYVEEAAKRHGITLRRTESDT